MRLAIRLLIPVAILSAGCPTTPKVCTDLAAASVMVTVEDTSGAAVPDVSVTYRASDDVVVDCDAGGSADGKHFVCGYEVDGEITVAASAPGFLESSDTVTVGMDDDGCHVIGELVTLTLTPDTP